jgi:hypothetical protein
MNVMMYYQGIKYFKNILCFMVNELSPYDTSLHLNKSGFGNIEL